MVSKDGGQTWAAAISSAPATTSFSDVACSASSCLALGLAGATPVLLGTTTGKIWQAAAPIAAGATAQAVGCAQIRWCLAIAGTSAGVVSATSTDGGRVWSSSSMPTGIGQVLTLACASTTLCITTGIDPNGNPQVLMTTTGSAGWETATLPTSVTAVLSGSCRSGGTCLVVARASGSATNQLLANASASSTFLVRAPLSEVPNPATISCAQSTCVVAGSTTGGVGALASITTKKRPQSISTTYVPTGFIDLSCALATRCVGATMSSLVQITPSVP
jgi:hypothetical protein